MLRITLIDPDVRRRANIGHSFSQVGVHVEPFERLTDLGARSGLSDFIMVVDDGDMVVDTLEFLRSKCEYVPVVAFSDTLSTDRIVDAIGLGAVDYLIWPAPSDAIEFRLNAAFARARKMGGKRARQARARLRIQRLTRREQEVLKGVVKGMTNRQIGEVLEISARTVEIHRTSMISKLDSGTTSGAIRVAVEAEFVE